MSNLFNNPDNLVDVVRQILSGKPLEEKKKEEELDPVNKQAVKKKFDDRKDKDIDNDGDVDSTDKYLHKRRKAISKALNEKEPKKKINASHCEEVELDEAKVAKKVPTKDGGTFVVLHRDTSGMKGSQDKFIMRVLKKGKVTDLGTHSSLDGAMKFAKNRGIIEEKTLDEAEHEDGDGEKMTDAQKKDMDGDGEKDTGEKKKKKKKDEKGEKEDDVKPDKVDTEPEMDNVKTMMSEREMTDKEKAKLDKLKKKYEGGEMHKSMKDQYGDKADEVFYGKLTKMAMGEEVDFNNHVEYLEEKQIDALKKKAEKTGIPYGILKQVYNRGMAAWRTGHRPGTTPQQWAFARVNSFATKSKGTWGGADKDLAAKARGSMKKEEVELDEDKKELAKISKELEGASKMHKGQSDRIKKMLDKGDMKEAKDGEEKDTNLIMQLRKAVSLRGNTVNFANGPEKVPANVANAFLMKYAKMKRPAEKDMMTKSGGKSLNHLKLAIKGKFEKPSSPLDLPKMKSEK